MRSLSEAKRAVALIIGASAIVAAAASLAGLTTVVISFGTGADPSDAFTPAAEPLSVRSETVAWAPDEPGLLRSVERQTRQDVGLAWVGAISGEANETWFSGGAQQRQVARAQLGTEVALDWTRHEITTYFYSVDGQVLGLDIVSEANLKTAGTETIAISEEFEVVMILRDGNWRVERLSRL